MCKLLQVASDTKNEQLSMCIRGRIEICWGRRVIEGGVAIFETKYRYRKLQIIWLGSSLYDVMRKSP